MYDIIDQQTEIIKQQAELIRRLSLLLLQHITTDEFCKVLDDDFKISIDDIK